MPKVSFVVAVYKVADYVERCMRSLFEQTLDDIEIVVVDDCTPDDSVAVIERVAADYPHRKGQYRIVSHEQNMGLPQTRKTGLLAATGEYLLFVDGDDYVESQMAELMYGKARETGADMVLCDYCCEFDNGRVWREKQLPDGVADEGTLDSIINRQIESYVWCKLMRRSLFLDNEIVWPLKGFHEDWVVSSMAAYYAKTVAYVPERLYHYVRFLGAYSYTRDEEALMRNFSECRENFAVMEAFFEREGVSERYEQGLFITKVKCKDVLRTLTGRRKYRKLFRNTFREVNRVFLWGDRHRRPTYRERVWMCAVLLGLYPKCHRALNSKYLRPRKGWK